MFKLYLTPLLRRIRMEKSLTRMHFKYNEIVIFCLPTASKYCLLLVLFFVLTPQFMSLSWAKETRTNIKIDVPEQVLMSFFDDMILPHEGLPAGVPDSYDWAKYPRAGKWNNPDSTFHAIIGWGQIFRVKNKKLDDECELSIRGLRTFILSKATNQWFKIEDDIVNGSLYRADYANNENSQKNYSINDEIISVKVPNGSVFHFWPESGRSKIDPTDIGAVLVIIQAKSIVKDHSLNQCMNEKTYLLGAGADYWIDKVTPWAQYTTNQDVVIGRLKLITNQWHWFGATTATKIQLYMLLNNGYKAIKKL